MKCRIFLLAVIFQCVFFNSTAQTFATMPIVQFRQDKTDRFTFEHLRVASVPYHYQGYDVWHMIRVWDNIHSNYVSEHEFSYRIKDTSDFSVDLLDTNRDGFIDFTLYADGRKYVHIQDPLTHAFRYNKLLSYASKTEYFTEKSRLKLTIYLSEITQEIELSLPDLAFASGKQFSQMMSNQYLEIDTFQIRLPLPTPVWSAEQHFGQPDILEIQDKKERIWTNKLHYFTGDSILIIGNRIGKLVSPSALEFKIERYNQAYEVWEDYQLMLRDTQFSIPHMHPTRFFTFYLGKAGSYPSELGILNELVQGRYRIVAYRHKSPVLTSGDFYVHLKKKE